MVFFSSSFELFTILGYVVVVALSSLIYITTTVCLLTRYYVGRIDLTQIVIRSFFSPHSDLDIRRIIGPWFE